MGWDEFFEALFFVDIFLLVVDAYLLGHRNGVKHATKDMKEILGKEKEKNGSLQR